MAWNSQERTWEQYTTPPRPNELKDITTMTPTKRAPEHEITITPKEGLRKSIVGKIDNASIGFLALTVQTVLSLLCLNTRNRQVKWGHLNTLIGNWRSGDWVTDANTYTISIADILTDGQHRLLSFVLAFGTASDVLYALKLLDQYRQFTFFELPKDKDGKITTTVLDVASAVPIKGYELAPIGTLVPQAYKAIGVLFDTDPRVAEVSGSDQAARTGGDMLGMNADTGNLLVQFGLTTKEGQDICGAIYRRVLPVSPKDAKDGGTYGSLKRSGKIHGDRYPEVMLRFRTAMASAMGYVHNDDRWAWDFIPLPHNHLIAGLTLAIDGGLDEDRLTAFLLAWGASKKITVGIDGKTPLTIPYFEELPKQKGTVAYWAAEAIRIQKDTSIEDKGDAARWTIIHQAYAVTRFVQSEDPNPKCTSIAQLIKIMGGDSRLKIENEPLNRAEGVDSTGCPELLTDSLKKAMKVRANAEKKLAEAGAAAAKAAQDHAATQQKKTAKA
jgi:hypothetical protein